MGNSSKSKSKKPHPFEVPLAAGNFVVSDNKNISYELLMNKSNTTGKQRRNEILEAGA